MSLISRLGRRFREKPKSTNLDLPSLPTPREILEDIESCQSQDPIMTFANLIQKKGKQSLLDSDFLEETSSSSQESHLAFLLPYKTGATSTTSEDSQVPGGKTAHTKSKGSSGTQHAGGSGGGGSRKKTSDVEQINNYNQLKQFMLLYEKSEELLENIEPHFSRIESTLRTCEAYSNPNNEDVENCKEQDNDSCSSPLL